MFCEVCLVLNCVFFTQTYILAPLKLQCADEDVIDGAVCIFKATIFKMNHLSESSCTDTRQMDAVLPLLLHLLDERDGTARAVVMLIAEYCSMYPSHTIHPFHNLEY